MNPAVILAESAGAAIAVQVVANSIGLRDLGGLICLSGATTALAGLTWALFAVRPETSGRALLCALASGLLGAFIVGSIVLAANRGGLAQTLSLVIAARLRPRARPPGRLRPRRLGRRAAQGLWRTPDPSRRCPRGPRVIRPLASPASQSTPA